MVTVTIHVTQANQRAGQILSAVSDQLGADFVGLDRTHGYFELPGPGPKRAFTRTRAAFDAVSDDWYHYFVINYPDG